MGTSSSVGAINSFDVDHSLGLLYLDAVPFDWYRFDTNAFVIEKATNKSVPIVAFAANEGPDTSVVSTTSESTKNEFTYDSGTGPTTVSVESSLVSVDITRTQFAQAFTMCLLLVNCALTVASVYITVLVLIGTDQKDPAIVLLPVTLVLTVPTIRGLFVGSPPFGIFIGGYRVVVSRFWD